MWRARKDSLSTEEADFVVRTKPASFCENLSFMDRLETISWKEDVRKWLISNNRYDNIFQVKTDVFGQQTRSH